MFTDLKKIIVEQLSDINDSDLTLETSLNDDLQADSLDIVEIIMALEEHFDIEIDDEAALNFKTLGDVVAYIEKATE
ncbi:MAG: acyl carrier protein [Clostridia bacterium]